MHLWVRDSGAGIPPEQQEGIFNRFEQADGSQSNTDAVTGPLIGMGLGLGLSIVASTARAHGGHVTVDSTRGMGVRTPVILLTARSSVSDTVHGLETGADGYMAKPFRFEGLLARIRLRLRVQAGDGADAASEPTVLTHDDLSLDLQTHRATVAGREIDLSAREFALAQEFLRHPGQALTREQLLSRVWGYDFDPASNVVHVYVRYLRRKLGAERIETERGVGYRLV